MLLETLKNEFKEAMKARDVEKKEILSYVIAQISAKAKDTQVDLADEDIMQLIKKEIKTRKEAIEMLTNAGKTEDVVVEQTKIDVLLQYLPEMMSESDLSVLIDWLISELWIEDVNKERGTLIGAIMKDHKAVIDGSLMNQVISSKIG